MADRKPPLPRTRRRFPRAELKVKARLSLVSDPRRQFEATLSTANLSVGGIFFESTYFLKRGTPVEVQLRLPPQDREVRVRGRVVRVEPSDRGRTGFAVQFTEYFGESELALAGFFLAPVLKDFIVRYAKKNQFDADPEYVAHMADLLAAWELNRAELADSVLWAERMRETPGRAGG